MSNSPVRVLQALRVMNRAGLETWLMHMLRGLDRREIAMDFLVQTQEPGAYDQEIRELGGRIIPCLVPSQPWRYAWNLKRALKRHGPYDVVHSHNYFFAGLDLKIAESAGVRRRIAHMHPHQDIEARRPLRGAYRTLTCGWIRRHATEILSPSYASLEALGRYADFSQIPQSVIRNCVDLEAYEKPFDRQAARRNLGLPLEPPVIAYVARFVPHKNHRLLLKVAERLQALGCEAVFAVAGTDGISSSDFRARIAGRKDFRVFPDLLDSAALLRCADLFVFPSLEEGFGTVAIEAAAAGLPVVATDLPGIREAVAPSNRAYMFSADDVDGAASAVESILRDRSLRRSLSLDAKRWAKQFRVDEVVNHLAAVYCMGRPAEVALR